VLRPDVPTGIQVVVSQVPELPGLDAPHAAMAHHEPRRHLPGEQRTQNAMVFPVQNTPLFFQLRRHRLNRRRSS
jgi:hypothetical protein